MMHSPKRPIFGRSGRPRAQSDRICAARPVVAEESPGGMHAGAVDRSVTERDRQDLLSRRPGNASVIIRDATPAMPAGSQVEDSLEGIFNGSMGLFAAPPGTDI
jgi:hypothetical protein